MSNRYVLVQWNRHKQVYDLLMLASMLAFLAAYIGIGLATSTYPPEVATPTLVLRALGSLAIVMLHVILSIGPLCRLDDRFLPLLYNRRHMGVAFFMVVLLHFVIALGYYGGFGSQNPISAVLVGSGKGVPFEFYGFFAFLIFAVMAATSHDFWLANLGPRFWKAMHMCIYAAYVLVLLHVVYGALHDREGVVGQGFLGLGVLWLGSIHILAGLGERRTDCAAGTPGEWVDVCGIDDIPASRARVVQVGESERIAIVNDNGRITALSNVCAHQGGPLGEGQVIDGCLTCPWHGYQYDPATGCSPPPYTERVNTYEVRIEGERVLLNPEPMARETEPRDDK